MKLASAALLVLLAVPSAPAPVRYEAQGIRVGGELVVGAPLSLKSIDASTLLVSGSAVENLGAPVAVALDATHELRLEPGLRLARQAEGFLLSSHGTSVVLEAAGKVLQAGASVAFTLTPAGFEVAGLGTVDALSLAARATPTAAAAAAPQDPVVSPERTARARAQARALAAKRRVFSNGNPFTSSAGSDREVLSPLSQLSVDGAN
jgi:hypothetical protein